jgi:hypothetical protein
MDVMIYNSALLWLFKISEVVGIRKGVVVSGKDAILVQNRTSRHLDDPLLLPEKANFMIQPALEIGRSIEYLLQNLAKSQDVLLTIAMPIGVAYTFLKRDDDLKIWLRKILDRDAWSREFFAEEYLLRYNIEL